MKTNHRQPRNELIEYVVHGGKKIPCSLPIGGGAGFDTKLAKKKMISQTTVQDTIRACKMFDMHPLYNAGLGNMAAWTDTFRYVVTSDRMDERGRRIVCAQYECAKGVLTEESIEQPCMGVSKTRYPVQNEQDLDLFEYFLDSLLRETDFSNVTEHTKNIRCQFGEQDALDIQWAMQPYELLCFPNTMETAVFAALFPKRCRRLMDKILELDAHLLQAVAKGGADFVFLGGPGSEMISPAYYEDFIVPYSKTLSQMAHEQGLLIYSHICSPIEPMLSMGYYNQMGIDLFETLSQPPVGNVISLKDAFMKLDPSICTRGNIGLDVLLSKTPDEIKAIVWEQMDTAYEMGRKHVIGASDYLFYDTPEENVHAVCDAVRTHQKKKDSLLPI